MSLACEEFPAKDRVNNVSRRQEDKEVQSNGCSWSFTAVHDGQWLSSWRKYKPHGEGYRSWKLLKLHSKMLTNKILTPTCLLLLCGWRASEKYCWLIPDTLSLFARACHCILLVSMPDYCSLYPTSETILNLGTPTVPDVSSFQNLRHLVRG